MIMKKLLTLIVGLSTSITLFSQVEIEPFAPSVPGTYLGDFNNFTNGQIIPDVSTDWTEEGNTATNDWIADDGTTIAFGGFPLYAYVGVQVNENITLISPSIDFGLNSNNPSMTFRYWLEDGTTAGLANSLGQSQLEVMYKVGAAGGWNVIATYTVVDNQWHDETVSLAGAGAYNDLYIGFRVTTNSPGAFFTNGLCLVDEIVITGEPNCSNTTSSISPVACGSYTVPSGDETYTATQSNIKDTIPNMAGCDSIITIDLTINPLPNIDAGPDQDVCVGNMITMTATGGLVYTWFPNITMPFPAPDTSITFIVMGADANSCSNSDTVTLNPVLIDTSVTSTDPILTANESGAAYVWLDCDNSMNPVGGANNQAFTATANGNYAVEITVNGCADTSLCHSITMASLDEFETSQINVYPNPTSGSFKIDFGIIKGAKIKIFSTDGKLIQSSDQNGLQIMNIELDQPQGVYLIEIENGDFIERIRLIKN